MPRRMIKQGNHFTLEFDTAGSGFYYATVKGEEKGPFPSEVIATRWIAAKLEGMLSTHEEDDMALLEAKKEADRRQGMQEQAAREGKPWRDEGRSDAELRAADELEEQQLREEQQRRQQAEDLQRQKEKAFAQEQGLDRPLSRAEKQELRRQDQAPE